MGDSFTAADVPRLRDRIVEYVTNPSGLALLLTVHPGSLQLPTDLQGRPHTIGSYVELVTSWLGAAELFFITSDMTQVVAAAARALPRYELHRESMPARIGFAVFGDSPCAIDAESGSNMRPGERCEVRAMLWVQIANLYGGASGVHLVTWQDCDVMLNTRAIDAADMASVRSLVGPLAYHEEYPLPWGNRPFGAPADVTVHNTAVGAALATWIMMGQRIITTTREQLPRSVRRPYTRAGRAEPVVRTATLRRAATHPNPEQSNTEPSRTYAHQWIVSGYGYWRNTWYPRSAEHRLQFVHVPAYVKGPAGAPLIGGERVNVLRR